jgi:phosphomannomutase
LAEHQSDRTRRINPALRRADHLSGVFGRTLTVDDAYGVGCAVAARALDAGHRRLGVSRDARRGSLELEAALIDGLRDSGMHVFRLLPGPTPLLTFAIHRIGLDGGVMVTGAHDPPECNGFKLFLGGSAPVFGAGLHALWEVEPAARGRGLVQDIDIGGEYLAALAAEVASVTPTSITWDSGSGATGELVERLVHRIPGRHFTLNTEMDGGFPGHGPDPAMAKNVTALSATVNAVAL